MFPLSLCLEKQLKLLSRVARQIIPGRRSKPRFFRPNLALSLCSLTSRFKGDLNWMGCNFF